MPFGASSNAKTILPSGGGQTGDLFRSLDWSKRPMGAIEDWPDSLKTSLRLIFHSKQAMSIFWGAENVQFYNDGYIPILGPRHPCMGKTAKESWPEVLVPIIETVRKGETISNEEHLISGMENEKLCDKYWNYAYSPIFNDDGKVDGVLAVYNEVTAQATAKKALVQSELLLRQALEDLEAYNSELQHAKNEAERANELKSFFLANMSHEIRTPLGAILGFADILRSSDLKEEERTNYIDIICRNGHALTKIIDDILDLSKIEAGKLDLEIMPICLLDLTRDVMAMFSDRANCKGIQLSFDEKTLPPFKIDSDPVRIRQVLVNLIGNAIKFTSKGSVEVKTSYEEKPDGTLKLIYRIIDTGIGMSPENAVGLFEPFTQADSRSSRKFGGTGLGLALSRKLSLALGGDIFIEACEENKGCIFKFIIQTRKSLNTDPHVERSHALENNNQELSGLKVLVVDDSPDNRALIEIYLKREGAEVSQAVDGASGIAMALEQNFDVVLMDIQMPGIDGYQALGELRYKNYTKPILALTAHAMKEERDRVFNAGFNDHLTKPVNVQELKRSILANVRKMMQ